MMSYERSNNRGELVGRVAGFTAREPQTKGERLRAAIKGPAGTAHLALDAPVGTSVSPGLRDDDDPDTFLTALARRDAAAGETLDVELPRPPGKRCRVRIIRSQAAIDRADDVLKRAYPRKRPVDVRVRARLGKPFEVELFCCDDPSLTACAQGFTVEKARTRPVSSDDLVEHVGRMGSSPFEMRTCSVELDEGCGMGFSAVHKVRTAACDLLEDAILAPSRRRAELAERLDIPSHRGVTSPASEHKDARSAEAMVCALATSLEAADAARRAGADRVYMATDDLDAAGISPPKPAGSASFPYLTRSAARATAWRSDSWVETSSRHRRR